MSRVVRVVLSVLAIGVGLGLLALGHDVRAWGQAELAAPSATWLPGDPAAGLVGTDDDLALRRAERAFAAAIRPSESYDVQGRARRRAAAEHALAEVVDAGSPAAASRAGNLLGILAATAGGADPAAAEQRAVGAFDAAIRGDARNDDAKFNLELLLRRIDAGVTEAPGFGSGDLGDALAGAGAGRPGTGF